MKVIDYMDYLVNGEIQQLAITDVGDLSKADSDSSLSALQKTNRDKIRSYVNLANLELHKKFSILQKNMDLDFALDGEEFSLPDDFLHAISVTYTDGEEIPINNTQKKIINDVDQLVSVLFNDPSKAVIKGTDSDGRKNFILTYAAAPKKAKTTAVNLSIPQIYTEALLNYASYKAHATVNGDMKSTNNTYYLRYNESCKQIKLLGLENPDNLDANTKLEDNGFV